MEKPRRHSVSAQVITLESEEVSLCYFTSWLKECGGSGSSYSVVFSKRVVVFMSFYFKQPMISSTPVKSNISHFSRRCNCRIHLYLWSLDCCSVWEYFPRVWWKYYLTCCCRECREWHAHSCTLLCKDILTTAVRVRRPLNTGNKKKKHV